MLFVVHAIDKKDILPTRAKLLSRTASISTKAAKHDVDVVTAGTLVADDGETPVGSIFVIDAKDRAAVGRASSAAIRTTSIACGRRCKSTATTRSAAPRSLVSRI